MPHPRHLSLLLLAASLATLGCHAQTPAPTAPGQPLPPELARRVEVLLRQKADLPPGAVIAIGPAQPSELPGYDVITITFTTSDGTTSRPLKFMLSTDGKTLAQFSKFDISANPRDLISPEGRPARGGPANAPVLIVGFDDLECPFCARLHESIFPAITQRYGDKVRIVYKDYPLTEIHPWAMRAAIDVNCLGAQSPTGYWSLVDYIHAHASEIGKTSAPPDPKNPAANPLNIANEQLDKAAREQAREHKADLAKLDACIAKQDTTAIDASRKLGASFNVEATPSLFINGDKIDGAVPIDFIFQIIDNALRAENIAPPPPFVPPTPQPAPAAKPATAAPSPGK